MINGNLSGIRTELIEKLETLFDIKISSKDFITKEITDILAEVTGEINREISVFISRNGNIMDVSVGDKHTVTLPYVRKRRGNASLSGVRCIHTHPNSPSNLSEIDITTLLSSRLDAMAAISVRGGKAKTMSVGYIGDSLLEPVIYGAFDIRRFPSEALMAEIQFATERVNELIRLKTTSDDVENALLLGLNADKNSMDELASLAKTAGVNVVAVETQNKVRDKSHYIGKGKISEVSLLIAALDVDVVITNDDLTPNENRNLEDRLSVKVIDRTTLILDIFAKHATTKEGCMQVELAQMKYNLPRLSGSGIVLSRLGGGIGTRGPGEQKIEVDRRRLRRRIFEFEKQIKELAIKRKEQRKQREKNRMKEVSLVGYTNAGKSSLLNALTNAGVLAENKLFATLDPVCRKLELPGGKQVLLTDTVGFIEKLPHDLVSAFSSTLEEVSRADLLLRVVDATDENWNSKCEVVDGVLYDIGAGDIPKLNVFNKCDLLDEMPEECGRNVYVSAKSKKNLDVLLAKIEEMLKPVLKTVSLRLKYSEGAILGKINECCENIITEYTPEGIDITCDMPQELLRSLKDRLI